MFARTKRMKMKYMTIFLFPIFLWGFLATLGCQKGGDTPEAQDNSGTSAESPMSEFAMPDMGKMPPGMEGQFPDEMLKAMGKMNTEGTASSEATRMPLPVVIPSDIQNKWKAVTIEVTNKDTGATNDYVIDIKGELTIPNTKLKVVVVNFVPHFLMSQSGITSASNELTNPAAKTIIYEDGTKKFEGWLFQKMPQVHAFEHEVYTIQLKGQTPA